MSISNWMDNFKRQEVPDGQEEWVHHTVFEMDQQFYSTFNMFKTQARLKGYENTENMVFKGWNYRTKQLVTIQFWNSPGDYPCCFNQHGNLNLKAYI